MIEFDLKRGEEFLVKVLKGNQETKTFDDLRYQSYCHSAKSLIEELPCTSESIRLHILRSIYIVFYHTNFFNIKLDILNPENYGWVKEDNVLLPQKIYNLFPPLQELVPSCTCKKCKTKWCIC